MSAIGRIILAVDSLDLGGGERHVADLAPALLRRGWAVDVACATSGPLAPRLGDQGVRVHVLGSTSIKRRGCPVFARRLRALITDSRADVVHTHSYATALAAAGSIGRHVHTEHSEALWRDASARAAARHAYRDMADVVAVSNSIRRRLIQVDGMDAGRVHVIPCAVPVSPIGGQRTAAPVAGAVGACARLCPEKGIDVFLEAASLLARRHPAVHFAVIGDGPLATELRKRAARPDLAGRVRFTGARLDARGLIATCRMLVIPSRSEGTPLVALEAMGAGVPVVAAAVGGIPDLIRDGRDGLLVPSDAPDALASAVERLLESPMLAGRLAENGRRRAETRFRFTVMLDRLEQVYKRVPRAAPGDRRHPRSVGRVTASLNGGEGGIERQDRIGPVLG